MVSMPPVRKACTIRQQPLGPKGEVGDMAYLATFVGSSLWAIAGQWEHRHRTRGLASRAERHASGGLTGARGAGATAASQARERGASASAIATDTADALSVMIHTRIAIDAWSAARQPPSESARHVPPQNRSLRATRRV